jgi:hypothetical protein
MVTLKLSREGTASFLSMTSSSSPYARNFENAMTSMDRPEEDHTLRGHRVLAGSRIGRSQAASTCDRVGSLKQPVQLEAFDSASDSPTGMNGQHNDQD